MAQWTYYDPSTGGYSTGGTIPGTVADQGDQPSGIYSDAWMRNKGSLIKKKKPKKPKKKKPTYNYSGSGGGGYSYSPSSGGGGGGGGGNDAWRQYGWDPEVFKGYRRFWGSTMPEELWPQYRSINDTFARYNERMMQIEDWKRIWQATRDYYTQGGIKRQHGFKNISRYGPVIARLAPPAKAVLPDVSYSQNLSF